MTGAPEDVPAVFTFDVGYTTARPVIPDEHVSRVIVAATSEAEATIIAALMVCRGERLVEEEHVPNMPRRAGVWDREVQMPTSTTLVSVEW